MNDSMVVSLQPPCHDDTYVFLGCLNYHSVKPSFACSFHVYPHFFSGRLCIKSATQAMDGRPAASGPLKFFSPPKFAGRGGSGMAPPMAPMAPNSSALPERSQSSVQAGGRRGLEEWNDVGGSVNDG